MAKKKKKKSAEEAGADGNVILFTALSMILLAFFIVLNSIAVIDTNRKLVALGSLLGSFGILPGGVLSDKGENLLPFESPITEPDDDFEATMQKMEKFIVDYQLAPEMTFASNSNELVISISTNVLFIKGTNRLNPKTLPLLNIVTRLVGTIGNPVRIEGHLEEGEYLPGSTDPLQYSLLRGLQVMEYMIKAGHIESRRFSVGGYGSLKPLTGSLRALGKKNGRIDVTLIGDIKKVVAEEKENFSFKGFLFNFNKESQSGK